MAVPTKIKLNAVGGILIQWSDGHEAIYPHAYLRNRCPCATCEDRPPEALDESPTSLPILGQRPVRALSALPVGHYAVQIKWNDGHQAGLYSFDYLRQICPCPDCSSSGE